MKLKIKAQFWLNGDFYDLNTVRESSLICKESHILDVRDVAVINLFYRYVPEYYGRGIYEKIEQEMKEKYNISISAERIRRIIKDDYKEQLGPTEKYVEID